MSAGSCRRTWRTPMLLELGSTGTGKLHERLEPTVSGWCHRERLTARLDMASEVVENCLPPFALLLDGMR